VRSILIVSERKDMGRFIICARKDLDWTIFLGPYRLETGELVNLDRPRDRQN
jgi:hypothetical protein